MEETSVKDGATTNTETSKKITSALISVYYKDGLEPIVRELEKQGVTIYSTGGTQSFIEKLDIPVIPVEKLTGYPSIFDGRVKTLHPKVFGGILARRNNLVDGKEMQEYEIPEIDLVVVDLYPFEATVKSGASEEDIIEKIDIGGISLIRAAAKNFDHVAIISSRSQYGKLLEVLQTKNGGTDIEDRRLFAAEAFAVSSGYDAHIFNYFNRGEKIPSIRIVGDNGKALRYGENPHQNGMFYGNLDEIFDILNGKELSYNNLVDVDAAVRGMQEFDVVFGDPKPFAVGIVKHKEFCGFKVMSNKDETLADIYQKAFECDKESAFGGIIISNEKIDLATAQRMHPLFFEVLIAPGFEAEALELLSKKKDRRILLLKRPLGNGKILKSVLDGVLEQDADVSKDTSFDVKTNKKPDLNKMWDARIAVKIVKCLGSNAIALIKDGQLIGMGCGQTSRADALRQAIDKAQRMGFGVKGSSMASEAFFPFPDCVEIGAAAGVEIIVQPGGSKNDQASIDKANELNVAMLFTGIRHFRH